MRLIDADKLKKHYAWWNNEEQRTFDQIVDAQPTVDTAVHGEWEIVDREVPRRYGCSECKRLSWWDYNYCPNCGAKMNEGDHDA